MIKLTGRLAAALTAVLLLLSTGGCSLSALTADNVMEPPQAYGDGAGLQAAMEDALGSQITLRYPRSGDHRSAVVRADVDNDGHEEAIVFYRPATESTGARMVLLDTDRRGDWTLTGEFSEAQGEIDRVIFGDVDGDGAQDIITGWMAYSDYGTVYVHSCSEGKLRQLNITPVDTGAYALSSYAELAVGDFDGDGAEELLTVAMAGTDNAGEARMLKWIKSMGQNGYGQIRRAGTLTLCSGAKEYTGSESGMFSALDYGMVVDSRRTDDSYCSELIMWDKENKRLVSPSRDEGQRLFRRTLNTESADIDGDGYIEIPGDSLMPNCESAAAQKIYTTHWYSCSSGGCMLDFSAVMRPDSGYYLTMPERWQGQLTAQPDTQTRTLRFYLADERHPFTSELMSLRVFTLEEWDEFEPEEDSPEYVELYTTDYYVYAVQITGGTAGLSIDYTSVMNSFHLMD